MHSFYFAWLVLCSSIACVTAAPLWSAPSGSAERSPSALHPRTGAEVVAESLLGSTAELDSFVKSIIPEWPADGELEETIIPKSKAYAESLTKERHPLRTYMEIPRPVDLPPDPVGTSSDTAGLKPGTDSSGNAQQPPPKKLKSNPPPPVAHPPPPIARPRMPGETATAYRNRLMHTAKYADSTGKIVVERDVAG